MKKLLVLCALVVALVLPQAASAQFITVQSVKNPVHHGWNNGLVVCDDAFAFCVPLGLNWFSNEPVFFTPIFFDGVFDGSVVVVDGALIPLIG